MHPLLWNIHPYLQERNIHPWEKVYTPGWLQVVDWPAVAILNCIDPSYTATAVLLKCTVWLPNTCTVQSLHWNWKLFLWIWIFWTLLNFQSDGQAESQYAAARKETEDRFGFYQVGNSTSHCLDRGVYYSWKIIRASRKDTPEPVCWKQELSG